MGGAQGAKEEDISMPQDAQLVKLQYTRLHFARQSSAGAVINFEMMGSFHLDSVAYRPRDEAMRKTVAANR